MVEALIALALLAIVMTKGILILNTTTRSTAEESARLEVEDRARQVLDRICYAIMGSDRASLIPDPESPIFSHSLRYRVSLGVEDGRVVWGDTEQITLSEQRTQVIWKQKPDEDEEVRLAWCNIVRPFLEGEISNGIDDNANGLIDEKGLTFTLNGNSVSILLTLERTTPEGTRYTQTVAAIATCRN